MKPYDTIPVFLKRYNIFNDTVNENDFSFFNKCVFDLSVLLFIKIVLYIYNKI